MAADASGRVIPGRFLFLDLRRASTQAALSVAACAALVLATRIPLRTHYLLNWDADQFALGIAHFDLVHHEPHPPGYPAYIALGRLLQPLFGDVNTTLVAISIAGECAAVALGFLFARALFGTFAAWVTALATMVSPLYWYYGEAANTYAVEPAVALGVAWLAWRTWNGDRSAAVPAGVALAIGGALRPSLAVLLAPLVVIAVLRLRSSKVTVAAAVAATVTAGAWAVPLVVASGGPLAYWHAATTLGADATASTAIWRAGLGGLLTSLDAVAKGAVWELGGFTVVAAYGLLVAPRLGVSPRLTQGYGAFAAVWALPALLTFLLVHIGQVAYVQVFMPAILLVLGPALSATVRALGRPDWGPPVAAVAAAGSLLIFLLPPGTSLFGQLRQHDAWVSGMTSAISSQDPAHTMLVCDAYATGSYRTAQVYLPEYRRVAVTRDTSGRLGEVFGDVYQPERLDDATPLVLPPGTETVVFVDRSVVDRYVADPERLRVISVLGGGRIYVWRGEAPVIRDGWIWLGPPPTHRRGLDA